MKHAYTDKPCPTCGRYSNRGVSTNGVIFNGDRVLLIRRGVEPFKGCWALPGGHVGWDETVEQSAAREVKEKTGLTTTNTTPIGVFSAPSRDPNQKINCSYLVEVNDITSLTAGDDAEEARWFSLDTLPDILAFDHRQQINDAITIIKEL